MKFSTFGQYLKPGFHLAESDSTFLQELHKSNTHNQWNFIKF